MKAVILAAGYGTRMLPITKTIPKEMLPVGNKPVIQYTIDGLTKAGINDIIIVTSSGKQAIEQYFEQDAHLEAVLEHKKKHDILKNVQATNNPANITFVKQHEMKGTGAAISLVEPRINDEYFMVIYADHVFHPGIFQEALDKHYATQKAIMVMKEVPQEDVYKYGVAQLDSEWHMTDIIEKPSVEEAPSNLITFSPYIIPKRMIELLLATEPDPKSGEIYPRDALKDVMLNEKVVAHVTKYPIRDTGNPEARHKANVEVGQHPELLA